MAPLLAPANSPIATRSLSQLPSTLVLRQGATTTAATADSSSTTGTTTLDGGAIAGIVVGSIVGFLLLLWVIRSCTNLGNPGLWGSTFGGSEEKPPPSSSRNAAMYEQAYEPSRGHRHSHHRSRSRHSHHHGRSPRRGSVEVRAASRTRPVYVEQPRPVYYARDSREAGRRDGRSKRPYYV